MDNEWIIKYRFSGMKDVEILEIYPDKVVYRNSTYKSVVQKDENILEDYRKVITDVEFIKEELLDKIYLLVKNDLISNYEKVRALDPKSLTRPKNSSRKELAFKDVDFKALVDMYVIEYGDIFTKFIEQIKKAVFTKINT